MRELSFYSRLFAYVIRMIRKVLKRDMLAIEDYAAETIILSEAEEGVSQAAITLKSEVDKATDGYEGNLSSFIKYATAIEVKHEATEVYRIENVVYDNGYLYKGFIAEHISSLGRPQNRKAKQVESMFLGSTAGGSRYFGVWLVSDSCRELIAREMGIEPLKVMPHSLYSHLPELNKLLNLKQTYNEGVIHIKNLYIPKDNGYNASKKKRCNELRDSLRGNIKPCDEVSDKVYILRGSGYASGRALVNEREVIEYFRSKGFLIIDPTKMSATQILEKILDCSVVVGIEGSQLAYGFLALRKGGLLLTLQPPYRFNSASRPRCDAVGVRWGFLVGDEVEGGFDIAIGDIESLFDVWK